MGLTGTVSPGPPATGLSVPSGTAPPGVVLAVGRSEPAVVLFPPAEVVLSAFVVAAVVLSCLVADVDLFALVDEVVFSDLVADVDLFALVDEVVLSDLVADVDLFAFVDEVVLSDLVPEVD